MAASRGLLVVCFVAAVACAALHTADAARPAAVNSRRALLQASADYQFFPGWDTESYDLKQMPGATIAQLAEACTADATCWGFNSWGWLKYNIKAPQFWRNVTGVRVGPESGLYVKNGLQPGSPHPMMPSGYNFFSWKDSLHGDIKQVPGLNPLQLAKLCDADPACLGFNVRGWLKSNIKPMACWYTPGNWSQDPNEGMYVKDGAPLQLPLPLVPGYKLHYLRDSVGGDIRQVTGWKDYAELGKICDAEPGCIAFTTGGWIKSTLKPESSWITWNIANSCNPTLGLYTKSSDAPAPAPGPAPAPAPTPAPAPEPAPGPAPAPAPAPEPAPSPAPDSPVAPKLPEKMGTWIPFYTWPSSQFDDLINTVEASSCLKGSFKGAVLIGPNNGPPVPGKDTLHREYFAKMAAMNEWTTFGYLHIGYGKRPLEEVLKQIDTWLIRGAEGFGDIIQGIWVNQVASSFDAEAEKYMDAVIARIKGYGAMVALNPGRAMDCKMAAKASFVNYFEDTYANWEKTKPACACSDVTRCIASIHGYNGAATPDGLAAVMAKARNSGFEATFVTDRVMPDHYDGLPSIWKAELEGLCKTTINA